MKPAVQTRLRAAACAAALALLLAACGSPAGEAAPTASPAPTAAPEATPAPEPTEAPESAASPAASESPAPSEAPESGGEGASLSVEAETMYPLLEAHMLAILNGGRFDAADPAYFWQTVSFAIDGCGLEFYSAETVGNALVLSRGVVEEIASGLFESASDLPEIPDALAGEIEYDSDADAYAHPLGGGGYSVSVLNGRGKRRAAPYARPRLRCGRRGRRLVHSGACGKHARRQLAVHLRGPLHRAALTAHRNVFTQHRTQLRQRTETLSHNADRGCAPNAPAQRFCQRRQPVRGIFIVAKL